MTLKFLDLSGRIQPYEEIFREIIRVTTIQEVYFFVVGAIARDLILGFGYGIESKRLTEDVDCGIQLANWQQFELLKGAIIQGEQFTSDLRETQRLWHTNGIKIDIVPFGAIENAGEIVWPPDGEIAMVTLGLNEAHKDTIRVRFANDVEVDVASLPGQALMKLIAWNDQPYRRGKDAVDLGFIMSNYLDAGNADRILGESADHMDLLTDDFDHYLTGSRLLGRDVGRL